MRSEIATTSLTLAEVSCSLSLDFRMAPAAVAMEPANSLHCRSTASVVEASDEALEDLGHEVLDALERALDIGRGGLHALGGDPGTSACCD